MLRWITSSLRLSVVLTLMLAAPAMAGEVVVVMGTSAAPLTRDQLADIYLGRSTALKPLDLPESSELRDVFYKKATERDAAQVKAVWSRLIFTGQGQPPKELPDAAAVKKAVAADPKMVGYIDKSELDASVKVVLSLH
jgi:ABC-type phosphate transport system substrate-binding protein